MNGVKANSGVGMENTRLWNPSIRQPLHPRPREVVLLTPVDQHGPPVWRNAERRSMFPGTAW
jgi:hypothetical protein